MKVLAIRGANLASLAGQFEVDFSAEPLASAGLYAITGPTGSGKSTLLDALCLALYGDTPRLQRVHRAEVPDVAGETLSLGDARHVLRRGAGEGHAEVDFIGVDGIGYRARWMARRARGRAEGRHQKVEMSLVRIHDESDAGGRLVTEVKEAIVSKVGLRFEQFTRAVLLAQNEFAVFLRADDNERAELLEMLTGTERFSLISRRAHERAAAERKNLERLQAQLSGQLPMDVAQRAELDAQCAAAVVRLTAVDEAIALLGAHLRWHEAWEQAKTAEQQAQAGVAAALEKNQEAAERRAALELIDLVQPARPLLEDCRRLAGEVDATGRKVVEADAAFARGVEMEREKGGQTTLAQAAVDDAENRRKAAAPGIEKAKLVTAQLLEREPERVAAHTALETATSQSADSKRKLVECKAGIEHLEAQRVEVEAWLTAHAGLEVLSLQWPRWESLLARAAASAADVDAADRGLPGLTDKARDAEQLRLAAMERSNALEAGMREAQASLESAVTAASRHDPHALAQRRQTIDKRRGELAAATQVWNTLQELVRQSDALGKASALAQVARSENAQSLEAARSELPAAEATAQAAAKALRAADIAAAESVEQLREALVPDEPCPVCGALDHPYAGQSPALRAVLESLRDGDAAARQVMDLVKKRIAAAEATEREMERAATQRARDLSALQVRCEEARRVWSALPVAGEAVAEEAGREAWLQLEIERNDAALHALEHDEQAMRDATAAKDKALAALEDIRARQKEASDLARKSTEAATAARDALSRAHQSREAAQRLLDSAMTELDGAFPDAAWRVRWRADPGLLFQDFAGRQAVEWRERQAKRVSIVSEIEQAKLGEKLLTERSDEAQRREQEARDRHQTIDLKVRQSKELLAELLGGRELAEYQKALDDAVKAATDALTATREAHAKATLTKAEAAEASRQAKQLQAELALKLEAARAALQGWITTFRSHDASRPQLDQPTLESLLANAPEWIATEREHLKSHEIAVNRARAILDDRRKHREALEAGRPSPESSEGLREKLKAVQSDRNDAIEKKAALELRRAQDDDRRKASEAMRQEVDAQSEKTRTWAQVDDLIGSVDGRKFRNIAQQMTLDVLLGYANRHLGTLARRYRLERVSGTLGLMVVDQDMGDELRSVLSLSGGESFLVSLALALALASLSSHRIRVESLFIDEGFGSLDADALRIALEALDGLQAQGRKVGVISHVQEMTERIGTQIRVERMTGGRSRVVCVG